jgi:hypothetical protein
MGSMGMTTRAASPAMSTGAVSHPGMMSGQAGHAGTSILPQWLAIVWTIVFLAVLGEHLRHTISSAGQRRWWHLAHVGMALGMAFMFAPSSIDPLHIAASTWQVVFAAGAGVVIAFAFAQLTSGRVVNPLWLLAAVDFGVMVYMWAPGGVVASVTWPLIGFLAAHAALWATGAYQRIDAQPRWRATAGGAGGGAAVVAVAAEPLVCGRDLRATLTTMTLGMGYMLAAMQLLT